VIDIVALERNVVKLMTVGSTLTFVENVLQRGVTPKKSEMLSTSNKSNKDATYEFPSF
jgi:hypothetical protein